MDADSRDRLADTIMADLAGNSIDTERPSTAGSTTRSTDRPTTMLTAPAIRPRSTPDQVGGSAIPLRDNHSVRVPDRQPDGRWLIVSEMYSDSRTDQTFAGHS